MMELVVAVVAGAVGYLGHVGQERFTHKQQQKTDDVAQIKALHAELLSLRDWEGTWHEAGEQASKLEGQAVLLRDAKLRKRVVDDLGYVQDAPLMVGRTKPRHNQKVWTQDALDCLAAAARGDRLPEPSHEYNTQLFYLEKTAKNIAAGLEPFAKAMSTDPEIAAIAQERRVWEEQRRERKGWRRILIRRR
ncbi:hypothetical protein OG357_05915 [Streptomyces sp. NBC_01255]|uniref:hypothetical protein n=1 Tax=Streptomyces sp. NBC_01255 TaxID=2903798 RepID=UPI002E30D483|nr:hypothetical protein [Streptomyces sp. NBC_01255]